MDNTKEAITSFVHDRVSGLVPPPFEQLVARKRARLRRSMIGGATASAVVVIVLSAIAVVVASSNGNGTKVSLAAPDVAAPQSQAYSYRGVQVEVPTAWSIEPPECASLPKAYAYTAGYGPYCARPPEAVAGREYVRFSSRAFDGASAAAARTSRTLDGEEVLSGTASATGDEVIVVASHDVLVLIHTLDPGLAKRVSESLSLPKVDRSGCPSSQPASSDTTPTAGTRRTLLPADKPVTASVCQYSSGLLQAASSLSSSEAASAANTVRGLAEGDGGVIAGRECRGAEQTFAVLFDYVDGQVFLHVDADGCRPLGVSLGTSHYGYNDGLRQLLALHAGRGANLAQGRQP